MECLLGITAGPLRSHPTAHAWAAEPTRCRGPQIVLGDLL